MECPVRIQNSIYGNNRGPPMVPHDSGSRPRIPSHKRRKIEAVSGVSIQSSLKRPRQNFASKENILAASVLPNGFPEELAFRALASYALLRTLSIELRLSPFTPNVFLRALYLPFPNSLLGQIHVQLLRILLPNLNLGYTYKEKGGVFDACKKRRLDGIRWKLRGGDNLTFLDSATWPLFYDDYCHLTADTLWASMHDEEMHYDPRTIGDPVGLDDYKDSESEDEIIQEDAQQFGRNHKQPSNRQATSMDTDEETDSDDSYCDDADYEYRRKRKRRKREECNRKTTESGQNIRPGDQAASLPPPKADTAHVAIQNMEWNQMQAARSLRAFPNVGLMSPSRYLAEMAIGMARSRLHTMLPQFSLGHAPRFLPPTASPSVSNLLPPARLSEAKLPDAGDHLQHLQNYQRFTDTRGQRFIQEAATAPISYNSENGGHPRRMPLQRNAAQEVINEPATFAGAKRPRGRTRNFALPLHVTEQTKPEAFPRLEHETESENENGNTRDMWNARMQRSNHSRQAGLSADDARREKPLKVAKSVVDSIQNFITDMEIAGGKTGVEEQVAETSADDDESFSRESGVDHWPQFTPLRSMRSGIPYHRLKTEEKLDILEFLLDELLTVNAIAVKISMRESLTGYHRTPYGPLPMVSELESIENNDECAVCQREGDLLCCDSCPSSYHGECIGIPIGTTLPDGKWFCPECRLIDPSMLGPLRGGRKSSLDWFTVNDVRTSANLPMPEPSLAVDCRKTNTLIGGPSDDDIVHANQESDSGEQSRPAEDSAPDVEFLIVHGFVFARKLGAVLHENSKYAEETYPLLTRESLKRQLHAFGSACSASWPFVQIPYAPSQPSSLVAGVSRPATVENYFVRDVSLNPSSYMSAYRKAPFPKMMKAGQGTQLRSTGHAQHEMPFNQGTTNILSEALSNDMLVDMRIAGALRSGTTLFDPYQMIKTFIDKTAGSLSRACLLHELWETKNKHWGINLRKAMSVPRLTRLLVRLVDAVHPRAFLDGWHDTIGSKNSDSASLPARPDSRSYLPLASDWNPDGESRKRKWERSSMFNMRKLLMGGACSSVPDGKTAQTAASEGSGAKRSKRKGSAISQVPYGVSPRGEGTQKAETEKPSSTRGEPSEPGGGSDKIAQIMAGRTDSSLDTHMIDVDEVKKSNGEMKLSEKSAVKVDTEEHNADLDEKPKTESATTRRSHRLRTQTDFVEKIESLVYISSSSSANGVGGKRNGLTTSIVAEVDERRKAKLAEVEQLMRLPFEKEVSWPVAGRELFDPPGHLPAIEMRRLARNAGSAVAPFVTYRRTHEVGLISFFHMWRKKARECSSFEELFMLVRILESYLDKTVIHTCESLVRRIVSVKGHAQKVVSCTQTDAATGLDHYFLVNKARKGCWVSWKDIELTALIIYKVRRRDHWTKIARERELERQREAAMKELARKEAARAAELEELRKKAAEKEALKKRKAAEREALKQKKAAEREALKKKREEEKAEQLKRRAAEKEAQAKMRAEKAEQARKKAEEARVARKKAEEAEMMKKKTEEMARKKAEEEEMGRKKAERKQPQKKKADRKGLDVTAGMAGDNVEPALQAFTASSLSKDLIALQSSFRSCPAPNMTHSALPQLAGTQELLSELPTNPFQQKQTQKTAGVKSKERAKKLECDFETMVLQHQHDSLKLLLDHGSNSSLVQPVHALRRKAMLRLKDATRMLSNHGVNGATDHALMSCLLEAERRALSTYQSHQRPNMGASAGSSELKASSEKEFSLSAAATARPSESACSSDHLSCPSALPDLPNQETLSNANSILRNSTSMQNGFPKNDDSSVLGMGESSMQQAFPHSQPSGLTAWTGNRDTFPRHSDLRAFGSYPMYPSNAYASPPSRMMVDIHNQSHNRGGGTEPSDFVNNSGVYYHYANNRLVSGAPESLRGAGLSRPYSSQTQQPYAATNYVPGFNAGPHLHQFATQAWPGASQSLASSLAGSSWEQNPLCISNPAEPQLSEQIASPLSFEPRTIEEMSDRLEDRGLSLLKFGSATQGQNEEGNTGGW